MRNKFKFILFGSLLLLIIGMGSATPVITPNPASASFTNLTDELPQEFSVNVNETTNITWYLDGSSVSSVTNQTSDSYSSSPSAGIHNVTVVALNTTTSLSSQFQWTWTVNESLSIDSFSPVSDPDTTVGTPQIFTVDTNQIAGITWYIDGDLVQTNSSQTSATYINSTAPAGTYEVKATVSNVNGTADQVWTWDVTAIPGPSITLSDPSSSSVSDNTGDSRTFEVTIDQPVNLTWIMNGTILRTDNSVASSSYTFNSAPQGSHNLTVFAENANGDDQEKWDWTVTDIPLSITDFNPGSNPETVVGDLQLFDITVNKISDIQWYINDSLVQTNSSSTSAEFRKSDASAGSYNVTVKASNSTSTVSKSWIWDVRSKTYFTGNRIWDENAGQSNVKYIWDAKSFSGFFYDLESGLSSETMTIYNIDRSLSSGDIVYQTRPVETDFQHSGWGKYQVIGFMAEKYFAAYTINTTINGVDRLSMMSSGQLSKILIDDDERESIFSGSSLTLKEGYALNIVEVDINGNSVFVTLTKDGDELDSDVISGGDDYVYKTDVGDADDVVLIAVHFDNIFSGRESNAVFVQGIFQISDDYLELDDGESFGNMEITSISDEMIEMENDGTISLSKGRNVVIMGKINLLVADNNDLRFAPYVDMSDPGTYELRGTVVEGAQLLTWNPLNFEGFYYDIDEGIQTESLELQSISGRTIPANGLVYTSTPASVDFEHSEWGKFNVIGFMAEKYFAGYTAGTDFDGASALSLISSGQLSKVLLDDDDKISVYSGSSLVLEEGYTLNIVEVDTNGESVLIELYKDGDEVDTDIVSADSDYVYEVELGDADDVPLIVIHFNEVFSGRESNAVFVQGIFQISEDYVSLESGDNYDKMEITSFGNSIVMKNENSISLNRDRDISLMGDIVLRVADSGTLRYYPAVEVTTAPSQTLNVDLSDSTVIEGEKVTITVTARGASISGATVKSEGTTIGTTGDDGRLDYTTSKAGTYEITAEKTGYTSGAEDLVVISEDDETKKMSIEVSPSEVYEGTSMTIFVIKAIGGDAISGATVTYDGRSIGTTGSDGTVTYTATEAGVHKLKATKSGMVDAELDLRVNELAAKFSFSNLGIAPLEIRQGKEATITVDVTNTGTAAGEYTVDLKINDVVVDSQLVSLAIGESTTIEFKHKEQEPGTYKVEVGGLSTTYEVFENSGTVWYVLGAIALAAVGGVAYLFTAGGWTVEIAQAKVAEAIEALKELVGNLR
ncbi:S-layer protein domain-containing protein [Methanolobus sp. WCC5]|uniref:S-layer protein domain-containing protein n=1 Tax=Methanolobus sp. WCC5 TaxID=3125785 RepID=UPI00324593B0